MIDDEIKQAIENAHSFGIVSHIRPDGDAIGAVLAMGLALLAREKSVEIVLRSGISKTFKHLPGADLVRRSFHGDYDLSIVLDCSDEERSGGVLEGKVPDIVVDHHITNPKFGKINLIEPDAVATCAILAEHMPRWGLEIDQKVASNLLSGIISDSIGFRTSNTTSKSLRIAADLMDKGADITRLYNRALVSKPFESYHYWGYGLVKLNRENGMVWTTLSLEDRRNAAYMDEDDADLTNILSSIEDIDVAVLFIEQNADHVKVSWRARPGINVASIAASFGGGGHPAAAGADIKGSLSEVQNMILQKTRDYLSTLTNGNNDPLPTKGME
ncbi:MAG TPA: DHH family phosphoesterase [Anaerolineaceae bacterium]|nr:DHH family phosphoesterase [Anaerolineaceae bacterium]